MRLIYLCRAQIDKTLLHLQADKVFIDEPCVKQS
jgi:hypothetical protein